MSDPDITIGVPTFNGARFIGEAVASAVRLPYPIVVSDDGSTDGTPDIVRRDFPERVELHVHGRRHGIARNFQFLLERCRTESILLLNQDDLLDARAFRAARPRPGEAIVLNGWVVGEDGRRKRLIYRRPPARALLLGAHRALVVENFIRTPTQVLCPAAAAREVGGFIVPRPRGQGGEDWLCWLRLASVGIRFRLAMRPAVAWREHRGSHSWSEAASLHESQRSVRRAMPPPPPRDRRLRLAW